MSGGVDSSVAALLLKNEGYDVVGVFMRCFNVDGCQDRDAEDARRVAENLNIPFYVWDFEKEYKKKVVKYMVDGYRNGITPNPDVMCNKEIKFGLFFDQAIAAGADYVATGHYVRVRRANSKLRMANNKKPLAISYKLLAAIDSNKDQSYFLWTLTQAQLSRCLFPIGDYLKPEVRAIARKAGLPTANKKDSQGICFLGDVPIADFLRIYIRPKRGEIHTLSGQKIGKHEGVYFYTIGQRHGLDLKDKNYELGITGEHKTLPHYVSEKDVKTNTLVVAEGEDNKALYKKEVTLANVNFINPVIDNKSPVSVLARVRYRQPVSEARLVISHKSSAGLVFKNPQKFVASGQSAVFYTKKGEMLGGGVIL